MCNIFAYIKHRVIIRHSELSNEYALYPRTPLCLRTKLGGALPSARRPLLQPGCPLHQSPCRCSAHHALLKLSQSRSDPFGRRLTLEALAWIAPSCDCRYRFDCRMCPNNQIPHCAQIFGHRFLRRRNTASRPRLNSHTFVSQIFRSQ